jgi:hypothetical protein
MFIAYHSVCGVKPQPRLVDSYGMFNDACIAHTQGYYGDYMDNREWEVPASSGTTLAQSLKRWLESSMASTPENTRASNIHVDAVSWPMNAPCSKYTAVPVV